MMETISYTAFKKVAGETFQYAGMVYAVSDSHAKRRLKETKGIELKSGDQLIAEGGRRVRVTS
jgi:hypothetical protein